MQLLLCGSDLAKSYGLDSVTGGILSLGTFFYVTQVPVNVLTPEEAPLGWVLPMSSLGEHLGCLGDLIYDFCSGSISFL